MQKLTAGQSRSNCGVLSHKWYVYTTCPLHGSGTIAEKGRRKITETRGWEGQEQTSVFFVYSKTAGLMNSQ